MAEKDTKKEDVWNGNKDIADAVNTAVLYFYNILQDIDPLRNYQVSYREEKVGRIVKSSKMKITFELVIEGKEHTISVYHSKVTAKKVIVLDGEVMYDTQDMVDIGLDYDFPEKIEGHKISVQIIDQFGWKYEILIDRVSMAELAEKRMKAQVTVTTAIPASKPAVTETPDVEDDESSSSSSSDDEEEVVSK